MIINKDIKPTRNIYFLGAVLLEVLKNEKFSAINTLDLYKNFERKLGYELSFEYYLLSLDWLYMLSLIESDENGDIKKCI